MIDPLVSLAFAIYSNKGAYAVLLGSGISRASGVPTGWEVVLDLVRKVAKLEGGVCEPDPVEWFKKKHGVGPDYSKLLDGIAKTPAERQQLLRGYFEPTDEERSQNLKLPSVAHKAIARLVADGYLRVIITTNFDRLMEKALEEVGIAPTVISSTDQLVGALPLAHSGATIVKLHGDYLDTRIRNTEQELAAYDKTLDTLLDRIFDEYGLIVSGWSGDWDIALRSAMERCSSRRFSTYWTARSPLSEKAQKLTELRRAEVVKNRDANQFFVELAEKVSALSDLSAPHPLSAKMAVATTKRYLVDPASRIRLHDLVHGETERLAAALIEQASMRQVETPKDHPKELLSRLLKYEGQTEILVAILAAGCFWVEPQHAKLWIGTLRRIAAIQNRSDGLVYLINLSRYPALLLFFSAGIGAVAAGNYHTLADLFMQPKIQQAGKDVPLVSGLYPMAVMEDEVGHMLPGMKQRRTPLSDYLYGKLREPLREYLPSDEDYQSAFDRFEYLLGLVHADIAKNEFNNAWWGPVGCFLWRGRSFGESHMPSVIAKELKESGANWPPLKAGFFGGSLEQATAAATKFNAHIGRLGYY